MEKEQTRIQGLKARAAAVAAGDAGAQALEIDPEDMEFGQRLAKQLDAEMSKDRSEEPKDPKKVEQETRMAAAARPQDFKTKLATMSFEEQLTATLECLERKNNQKEILYDLLQFCMQERPEAEAEAFLEGHKQFADGYHTASKYLLFMQRTGAIEERAYAEDGTLVTDEVCQAAVEAGATEEEAEEMAVSWSYVTTEVGKAAIEAFDPVKRTRAMLATQKESRLASYKRLLEFCETPRSLNEIVAFMDGDPGLEVDSRTGVMQMQPSAYIGKLDQAGALTWEDGWKTTGGGMEVLATLELD